MSPGNESIISPRVKNDKKEEKEEINVIVELA
jgi:hypothetical protein